MDLPRIIIAKTHSEVGKTYRLATAIKDNVLVPAGTHLRGHEFRYSKLISPATFPWAYSIGNSGHNDKSMEGYASGNILASYLYLHWAAYPESKARFIKRCHNHIEGDI